MIGTSSIIVAVVSTIVALIFVNWSYINRNPPSSKNKCLIPLSPLLQELFQPIINCDFCKPIRTIKREANLSPVNFEKWYAYNSRPVIVTDAQTNWTAGQVFSVRYLVDLYRDQSFNVEHKSHCQFFPYATKYKYLEEALHDIDPDRPMNRRRKSNGLTNNIKKPWYFGWSNCNPFVSDILKTHYSKPYFLPENSYSALIDWIFMGQPGYGANMHIDRVKRPSWQAQIRGRKQWVLLPPYECYKVCHKLEFDVNPGEILVLDTNVWFHQTTIIGEDTSIVIGSEYD